MSCKNGNAFLTGHFIWESSENPSELFLSLYSYFTPACGSVTQIVLNASAEIQVL